MFFRGWDTLHRMLIVGVLAYTALVIFLRVSGKRTLTEDEIRATIRSAGFSSLEKVHAVILETDGSFSVVGRGGDSSSLVGVNGPGKSNKPDSEC